MYTYKCICLVGRQASHSQLAGQKQAGQQAAERVEPAGRDYR